MIYHFFSDFSIPTHLEVLFIYSRYAFRYASRHRRSSGIALWKCAIVSMMESDKKSYEAEAMLVPINIKGKVKRNCILDKP